MIINYMKIQQNPFVLQQLKRPTAKGEASFSFFTGDIDGRLKIVGQGVGADDAFYGESEFSVK